MWWRKMMWLLVVDIVGLLRNIVEFFVVNYIGMRRVGEGIRFGIIIGT
jgi:hypothetical protein